MPVGPLPSPSEERVWGRNIVALRVAVEQSRFFGFGFLCFLTIWEQFGKREIWKGGGTTMKQEAQFLLDRLDEYDPEDEDHVRDFHGHVTPAMARLRRALADKPEPRTTKKQGLDLAR